MEEGRWVVVDSEYHHQGGGGWSWREVKMSWVEVDGAGWRWVHGLVIPNYNAIL